MVKSRADIQREYRRRKKEKEGEEYLEKERKRVKVYYVPIQDRTPAERKKRRENVRKFVRQHRLKKLQEKHQSTRSETASTSTKRDEVEDEFGVSSTRPSTSSVMTVKLPSFDPKNRSRKRIARATANHHREIKKLRAANDNLKKQLKRISKRYERLSKRTNKVSRAKTGNEIDSSNKETNTLTPRKRVAEDIADLGISPRKVPKRVKDTLLMAHVLTNEIKTARQLNGQKGKHMIAKIISGKLLKKYQMRNRLNKQTGLSRKVKCLNQHIHSYPRIKKRVQERENLKREVNDFLLRDDNSRVMPGKNDKVKDGSEHKQKRVLNDSLKFLHMKFQSETDNKVSFATFCRLRPKNVSLTRYITRNQCLCQKHQNMALSLKALKSAGATVPLNPDEFVRKLEETDLLDENKEKLNQTIYHQQWKKVTMTDGKKRTKIVGSDVPNEEFQKLIRDQTADFIDHVKRIRCQYKAMRELKDNMKDEHCIIQMDFAENFSCVSADEVQSAYWNQGSVTLHPVVVYYKENDMLKHINYVFVSDDFGHNIGLVYAILKQLIPDIKSKVPKVSKVFYWTDSPSSQYRNKTSFYIVSAHAELFGVSAEWNYWECGHGKGACDGIGGTAKRMADMSVRQGKVNIQDGVDFFEWGRQFHDSALYKYVHDDECRIARSELDEINKKLIPLKGTMKVHHVFSPSTGIVRSRRTSCYCEECVSDSHHDFEENKIVREPFRVDTNSQQADNGQAEVNNNPSSEELLAIDVEKPSEETLSTENFDRIFSEKEWVVVDYEKEWHVGKIEDVDEADRDYLVSFMKKINIQDKTKLAFKWPVPPDELWVKHRAIILKISEPLKVGRSGRSFQLCDEDINKLTELELL